MKKTAVLLSCLVALLLACCAAFGEEVPVRVPLADTAAEVLHDAANLNEMDPEDLSDLLGIEPSEYTEVLWLAGEALEGREVLVIRAVDAASADHIQEELTFYLEQRLKETRNYLPVAYALLSGAHVARQNNTVALVVGSDAAAETEALLAGE